jgi:hypothetical protein
MPPRIGPDVAPSLALRPSRGELLADLVGHADPGGTLGGD